MALTNAFRDWLTAAVVNSGSPVFYTNANAHLGVGNSATAFALSQTDLIGASKFRKPMDATFPTIAANVLTFKATFATGDANFSWDEWAVFNAPSAGVMMSRKVEALGTKTVSATWALTVTITFTV